jgi:hypothetical protein
MMLEWSVEFVVRPWLRPGRRDARVRGLRAARVHAHTGRPRVMVVAPLERVRGLVWHPQRAAFFRFGFLGFLTTCGEL